MTCFLTRGQICFPALNLFRTTIFLVKSAHKALAEEVIDDPWSLNLLFAHCSFATLRFYTI